MKAVAIIVAAAIAGACGAAAVVSRPGPPSPALLHDIQETQQQIAQAQTDAASTGGVVGAEAHLRLETLRATAAMLEERRLSWLHGIEVKFPNARPGTLVSSAERVRIEADLSRAQAAAANADAEASQYSGGLIQTLALVRAATERVTAAQLQQQLAYAQFSQPIPGSSNSSEPLHPPTPGKATSDKDAL